MSGLAVAPTDKRTGKELVESAEAAQQAMSQLVRAQAVAAEKLAALEVTADVVSGVKTPFIIEREAAGIRGDLLNESGCEYHFDRAKEEMDDLLALTRFLVARSRASDTAKAA